MSASKGKQKESPPSDQLPAELDFFKYAQNTDPNAKRKRAEDSKPANKKQKFSEDEQEDEDEGSPAPSASTSAMPRQRVTAKGQNVPQSLETFQDLADRYGMNAQFLRNLEQSGYREPTGIQAHGIPILHEVTPQTLLPPFFRAHISRNTEGA